MIGLKLVQDAQSELFSVSDAKNFLKVDSADTPDDALIGTMIRAARRYCENYTKRAFLTQTWEFWLDRFPTGRPLSRQWWDGTREGSLIDLTGSIGWITVPKAPLLSIVSLYTFGTDDLPTPYNLSSLVIDTASDPGRVFPKVGQIWPVTLRPTAAIKLTFKAGYGDSISSVPDDIIHACYNLVAHFYENRGAVSPSSLSVLPFSIKAILDPYRVIGL